MLDKLTGTEPDVVAAAAKDKKQVAEWIKALGAPTPDARSRAAFLLAQLADPPKDAPKKLAAQIKKEKDEGARASEILALGETSRKTGTHEFAELLDELIGDDDEDESPKPPPLLVRLAATLALGWSDPLWLMKSQVDFLAENNKATGKPKTFPWNGGDMGGIIDLALPALSKVDVGAALSSMTALIEEHPPEEVKGERPSWDDEVLSPWTRLVQRVGASLEGREQDEPVWSELSPDIQRVLKFGVEKRLHMIFSELGLDFQVPDDARMTSWRRFVGLDPAGPLDRELTLAHEGQSRTLPLWKWFRMLNHDKVKAEDLSAALSKSLTPAEIVELCREGTHMIYCAPREDGLGKSPRSSVLYGLLEGLGDSVQAPDMEGIRYVLTAIHNRKTWDMKGAGWVSGPFVPKAKKGKK